jgi:hypothetical protein
MDLNKIPLTRLAHHLITQHFAQQGCESLYAVDATCGNGFDTIFLAKLEFKNILAFDVQAQALISTKTRLAKMADTIDLESIMLILDGHENMAHHITQRIDCAVFNLGFLPKADHTITTCAQSTLLALDATLAALSQHGLITLICYPGHARGANETKAVQQWLSNLDEQWQVKTQLSQSPNPNTPILYWVKHSQKNNVELSEHRLNRDDNEPTM